MKKLPIYVSAVVLVVVSTVIQAWSADFYVAPSGSDSNPGTISQPFATIPKAVTVVAAGDTIFVRGGTHSYSSTISIGKSGNASATIKLLAYPGEQPLIDFSTQPYGSNNRGILFTTNGNYWECKGLEIAHAGDNGVKVEGSHLRFEQCVFHHNGDSGMQIGFGHDTANPGANLAAFIEVINCDSYRNYDPDNRGSDADGFAAKLHCGQGIVFIGCRAWENSDDGWDLFETDASVVVSNCWQWHSGDGALFPGSGSFQGNGNGFKLGGNGAGGSSAGTHFAYNCVAFNNKFKSNAQGFTQNSHKDGETVFNCLSFSNGASAYNYFFEGGVNSGKVNQLKNCVSIPRPGSATGVSVDPDVVMQNDSWTLAVTANAADYADLTESAAAAPRQADGSLPNNGFARLVSGSDLIDKGVNVGLPFSGASPDLGPFEFGGGGGTQPPAAPSGLGATAVSSTQINLSWTDNANNETGFKIERSTNGTAFSQFATVGANITSFSDTGRTPSTTYWYRVRANNSGGDSAYSNVASATTQPGGGNVPPTVSITAPANGATFTAPANITVSANASDTDGTVTNVAFFANGSPIGSDASSPYSIAWNNVAAGSYSLTAVATDNGGAQTTSTAVNITVNPGGGGGTTVTFESVGADDGRILESSEASNTGGSVNSSDANTSALRTGDDNSDRQFKTILSFDTSSLPDGATIVSATVRMRRGSLTGTNPFTTLGSCFVDIKGGTGFSGSVATQTGDFQVAADATQVATMSDPGADGALSSGAINATGRGFINKTGKTQVRVYFSSDDNDNATNDYIGWFSGNDATAGNRPTLEITYQ